MWLITILQFYIVDVINKVKKVFNIEFTFVQAMPCTSCSDVIFCSLRFASFYMYAREAYSSCNFSLLCRSTVTHERAVVFQVNFLFLMLFRCRVRGPALSRHSVTRVLEEISLKGGSYVQTNIAVADHPKSM